MKKYLTIFLTLIASIILVFVFDNRTVEAATPNGVNYSISPELPSNQISKNIGYYDLKVTPGQSETIKFKINNTDTKEHSYKVSVNRAATDINGVIDYNDHGIAPDSDLQYNIEKLVTYPKEVTVAANSSKEVSIKLDAPKGDFSGELLGGIFVQENNQINNDKKLPKGVTLRNQYNYVLGLQLQQNTDAVKPDLKFVKVFETDNNGQISVDGEMDNDVPTLENKVSVDAKVTAQNSSKIILKSDKKAMSMAPNSDFYYPVNVNTVTGPSKNKRLKPGKYTMYLSVKANNGKNHWNLKRNFVVTKKQMAKINHKNPDRAMDLWIILGAILALVVIAGFVIKHYRKNSR
ncbi:DUF916 and DUF3324 domain-containing protein [Companilactobacillus huachuanensis]|uniref:DUF916 and DUF3324 domain-containing protein n=1 Tax=Companilactobacillus huachuanensis TaxID=2559914 RepID=A0ABW1RLB8_9LACO|nr:DUF916 and DUF3324 domain-containing protein [Companilactobacillus huachuanensis]